MINSLNLERQLASHFAQRFNRQLDASDNGVYSGKIPSTVSQGIAFIIGSPLNENLPELRSFELQIIGKFFSRSDASNALDSARSIAPYFGLTISETTVKSITFIDTGALFMDADNGKVKVFFSINFKIAC